MMPHERIGDEAVPVRKEYDRHPGDDIARYKAWVSFFRRHP